MDATNLQRSTGAQVIVPRGLAVDPFNPLNITVGYDDLGLRISRDGGTWWEWAYKGITNLEAHAMQAVAYDPRVKDRLFVGGGGKWGATYLHVYQSSDGGATFSAIGIPQSVPQMQSGKVVGTTNIPLLDQNAVHAIAVAPLSNSSQIQLYVATSLGVFETTDGGKTWNDISGPLAGQWVHAIQIDPFNSQRILAAVGGNPKSIPLAGGLYISNDGGQSWAQSGKGIFKDVLRLSLSPSSSGNLLVTAEPCTGNCTGPAGFWSNKRTYLSTDGGQTWAQLNTSSVTKNASIAFAHFNPANASTIYIATGPQDLAADPMGLFVSRDGGHTWKGIDDSLPFSLFTFPFSPGNANTQIVSDPQNPQHLFFLHNFGVNEGWDNGP
jgi:photosystem II stability/assembly factor-like uncharacterized protein